MFLYHVGLQIATNDERWVIRALDTGMGNVIVHMLQEIADEHMKKCAMVTVIVTHYFMGAFSSDDGKWWEILTVCEPEWCQDWADALGSDPVP